MKYKAVRVGMVIIFRQYIYKMYKVSVAADIS